MPTPLSHVPFLPLRPPLLSLFCRASRSLHRAHQLPPPRHTPLCIIKSANQQASIFLHQKLKSARIVDATCVRGFNKRAVQRCLEVATGPEEHRMIIACMHGRIVDLATNCYGTIPQKALDGKDEEVRLLIVSELLRGNPATTLVNKPASHVWSKSVKAKWAALACHETGSLRGFESLEKSAKDGIVDELLGQGAAVFSEVAKSEWRSYCIQHILEHASEKHRQMALEQPLTGLLDKSVVKALKEGGKETLDRAVRHMCEPAKGTARRTMTVDLALSLTGSQLIASVLPIADKDQCAVL
ncbi:hypothetical protein B0H13DRAFT_2234209 [Mycena leptocephala]|nr:hypothetical protein B0H13DRAFT_2234209 [Mycena leptocephala]